ncbi:MAG: proprotein convertase P-domain-containing protein, partial [Chitinophagales bacterium]
MRNFTLCFLAIFLCFYSYAQTNQQLAKTATPLSDVERITLPKVNNKFLKKKELAARAVTKSRAIQFAEPIEVSITPQTHGTWENLKKGDAVWRLKLHSANALSLNLGFHQFFLPKNSRFFVYTPDYKKVLGPFTASDNDLHKQLWTPIIEGDEVVLELQIAPENISELALELGTVNHDFMGFGQKLLSGSCNLDVICSAPDGFPRVDEHRDIIRSAAVYSIGGSLACSGALINNARNDCTPYFLTADHCGVRSNNAASVVVYWNFENSVCRQPNSPESGGAGDGSLADFNTGSDLKATYQPTDFTLIELDDPVSETAEAFFAGWNKEADLPDGAIGIHHPNTDEKRISFENDPCTLGNFGGTTPETHVVVNDWDTGTTEPGSSGSPLFNLQGQIIGQLSGGGAACGNDLSDEYGWIHKSWEGGGSPQTRLKDWLDPDGVGIAGVGGKDCSYGLSLTESFAEVCNQNLDSFTFDLTITDNFVGNVGVFTGDIPTGLNLEYSANPISTGGTMTVTITNLSGLTTGTYSIEFFASDGFDTGSTIFNIAIVEDIPTTPALSNPPNEETDVTTNPIYEWQMIEDALYSIEVALDENFENLIIDTDNLVNENFTGISLEPVTTYYWHTKARNVCGDGEWSETFRFTTADIRCTLPQANDLPIEIPNFPAGTITSSLEIDQLGVISDIDVVGLRGTHSFVGDLEFTLISPAGTEVVLIAGQCGGNANFDVGFNDDAATVPPCPYADGNIYRPVQALAAFNGESPLGIWTLRVRDTFNGDGGSLDNWGLQICVAPDFALLASESITACVNQALEIPIRIGDAFEDSGVTMGINGLPDDAVVTYSETPAIPGSTVIATVSNITAIGVYPLTVSASDGLHNSFTQINLIVVPPIAASPTPNLPENESVLDGLVATMNWGILGGITGYHVEIATDMDFNNVVVSEVIPTVDFTSPALDGNTTYYWRVSGVNACGDGD